MAMPSGHGSRPDGGQAASGRTAGTSADAGDPRADAADAANTADEIGAADRRATLRRPSRWRRRRSRSTTPRSRRRRGWNDPLTGTDGPHYWDRLIISESARVRRYKRPATIVLVEVAGLDPARPAVGPGRRRADARQRGAGRCRSRSGRATTSPGSSRSGSAILLTETAEIAAINFIERARAACERDLRVASEVVGVAFGWASPPKSDDLADAVALAQKRLEAELNELEFRVSPARQSRPRRRARPGVAPVWPPSSTTSTPLTITCSMPSGNWRGSS